MTSLFALAESTESFLDDVPLDALIRMMSIVGAAGFKDDAHLEWNGLVWRAAALRGAMWEV